LVARVQLASLHRAALLLPARLPNCRAYKLGKKRWSYNQVELVLAEEGGDRTAAVVQALHVGGAEFHEAHQASHSFAALIPC
jgi:hypothetical protein